MAYLKDEIPADIAEILLQAEARADECWRALHLRHYPADLAIWAVLTGGIRMVEGEQATRGSNTPHFDAMLANLSRLLAVGRGYVQGLTRLSQHTPWQDTRFTLDRAASRLLATVH